MVISKRVLKYTLLIRYPSGDWILLNITQNLKWEWLAMNQVIKFDHSDWLIKSHMVSHSLITFLLICQRTATNWSKQANRAMTGLAGNFAKLELLYQGNNNNKKKNSRWFRKKRILYVFQGKLVPIWIYKKILIIDSRENFSALISDFIRQAPHIPCHCTNNEFVGLIECAWVVNSS